MSCLQLFSLKSSFKGFARGAVALLFVFFGCRESHQEEISLQPDDFPYRYADKQVLTEEGRSVDFVDLNGDGIDERIICSASENINQSHVNIDQFNGTSVDQINFPPTQKVQYQFAYDFNGDGDKDLFIVTREHDTLYLNIVDAYHSVHSSLLKRFPLSYCQDSVPRFAPDEDLKFDGIVLTGTQGKVLIVGRFCSYMSKGPRGVVAYDLAAGKLVWFFPTGPNPDQICLEMSNHNICMGIFCGSISPGNGVSANGTDDSHTYLFAFSPEGKPLWPPKQVGNSFAIVRTFLDDLNSDGVPELVCLFSSGNKTIERSFIEKINPVNGLQVGAVKNFDDLLVLSPEYPASFRDNQKQFILCTTNGTLYILDPNLRSVAKKHLPSGVESASYLDIDADREIDIVLRLKTNETIVLDDDLHPLMHWMGGKVSIGVTNCFPDRQTMIVIRSGLETHLGRLVQAPASFPTWLIGVLILVVLVPIGYGVYRGIYYHQIFMRAMGRSRYFGLLVMNTRRKITFVNDQFLDLFSLDRKAIQGVSLDTAFQNDSLADLRTAINERISPTGNLQIDTNIKRGGAQVYIRARVHPIVLWGHKFVGWLIAFYDITDIIRKERLVMWASTAQELAHQMKTPLSTIWFTVERIRQLGGGKKSIDGDLLESIEEEVQRLDRYVKGFMKLANINPPIYEDVDLNKVISEYLDQYMKILPDTVKIETDYGSDIPGTRLDVNLFTIAIGNLLDNAVRAIEGQGVVRVSTYLAQDLRGTWVYICIADTGPGIPKADQSRVFEPFFSRSDGGTGLGLVYTKKIVEDHDGTIDFITTEGLGTEFTIRLPAQTSGRRGEDA